MLRKYRSLTIYCSVSHYTLHPFDRKKNIQEKKEKREVRGKVQRSHSEGNFVSQARHHYQLVSERATAMEIYGDICTVY